MYKRQPLAAWAFTHLDWCPDWKVLDIGCGGGANIAHMLKRCPQGQVYGVDISPESVAFARQKNKAFLDERCFILQGTASDLPFEGDTFDVATAFETLYFWEDPDKAFCEILRILKPGGIFLIACEASNPHNTTWTDRIEGMSVYTAEEIKHKLENCGFVHVRTDKMKKESICVTAQKTKEPTQYSNL